VLAVAGVDFIHPAWQIGASLGTDSAMMLALLASSFPFSKDESTQWLVLAVGVLATLYVIMRPKMRAKRDPMERAPATMGLAQQRQFERDVNHLMVEMLETARQMTAQLDTRAARLEVLIRQADERLGALKAVTAGTAAAEATELAAAAGTDVAQDPPAPAPVLKPETPPDPRHAEVYAMADQGRSPHEIARLLGRPNGEVELILALRPHQSDPSDL
jgi:hypothetical protein